MSGHDLLHDIVFARALGGLRLHLKFSDGVEGDVDLRQVIRKFEGLLAPLADPAYVALVSVNPELGTVTWPNGVDLDELVLYCAVRGIAVPTYEQKRVAQRPTSGTGVARRRGKVAASKKRAPARTRTAKGSRRTGA